MKEYIVAIWSDDDGPGSYLTVHVIKAVDIDEACLDAKNERFKSGRRVNLATEERSYCLSASILVDGKATVIFEG